MRSNSVAALGDRIVRAVPRAWRRRKAHRFYRAWLRPGDLCFDVGANVGERTRVFLAVGARVVAIEPQPECVSALNDLRHPCLAVEPLAVGASPGTADLHIGSSSTISSMAPQWIRSVSTSGRFAEEAWSRTIRVKVTTLDALIERHGVPDFCKIDVEGYEADVVAGLSRSLPLVSFEFVSEFAEGWGAAVAHLRELGMDRFNFSRGESFRLAWDDWRDSEELAHELESLPKDGQAWGDVYARPR